MPKVVGIRFRAAGKMYWFDPGKFTPVMASHVIVETARGLEYGEVIAPVQAVAEESLVMPLKKVLRMATKDDEAKEQASREKEESARLIAEEKILKHNLPMKLVGVEITFDASKIVFYFTADGRIDFRELVRDLASQFRTRIELRQIGVRDEAKMLGGYGCCGRPLCCSTFLGEFAPVSIKMAKEQSLSLNPAKISGICGRLMCCLKYENDTYISLKAEAPGIGSVVELEDGSQARITNVNVVRQVAMVERNEDVKDYFELPLATIATLPMLFDSRKKRSTKPIRDKFSDEKGPEEKPASEGKPASALPGKPGPAPQGKPSPAPIDKPAPLEKPASQQPAQVDNE
jgi:cell fate regulator YaaT (PSP1 superfamily)